MKLSQFIENSELSLNSPITREEWDRITDVELERTEEITFRTPSGKEVPFRKVKHGKWAKSGQSFLHPKKFISYCCSECGYEDTEKIKYNFCPNCGADMRGREETNE